ncbi:T9SS type A sorting domain-containing protein [Marinoscillum sp. MHG1-6]|uniref:T9SS type A sorting domain-containing protein n=1 Tax=Marinoscillum sp. MHG1-6 TaxID=2959627 RepID=UPI0021585390|nr:T9SS type A sorting domain-containing protein [Marinoscillum sp. MHG1-6]
MRALLKIFVFLLIGVSTAYSQSAITASGGDITSASGTISYSIGQLFYATLTTETGILVEGILHPSETIEIKALNNNSLEVLKIVPYPNPTSEKVVLNLDGISGDNPSFVLYDPKGKEVAKEIIQGNEILIEMEHLAPSTYYLVLNGLELDQRIYKIIKH